MAVHRTDREFSNRSLDDVARAFRVDRSWYERHWYGPAEAARHQRPSVVRRPSTGLAALSVVAVFAMAWL